MTRVDILIDLREFADLAMSLSIGFVVTLNSGTTRGMKRLRGVRHHSDITVTDLVYTNGLHASPHNLPRLTRCYRGVRRLLRQIFSFSCFCCCRCCCQIHRQAAAANPSRNRDQGHQSLRTYILMHTNSVIASTHLLRGFCHAPSISRPSASRRPSIFSF